MDTLPIMCVFPRLRHLLQGMNAQFGGTRQDSLAYVDWLQTQALWQVRPPRGWEGRIHAGSMQDPRRRVCSSGVWPGV